MDPGHGGLIKEPNVNDVLSGRGGRINSHPGNIQFRALVHQYKHTYLSKATKKLDKVKIADRIVQGIRNMDPSGRFLKEDSKTHQWIEIGDEKARKKAGQAMRERADETRKELKTNEFLDFPGMNRIINTDRNPNHNPNQGFAGDGGIINTNPNPNQGFSVDGGNGQNPYYNPGRGQHNGHQQFDNCNDNNGSAGFQQQQGGVAYSAYPGNNFDGQPQQFGIHSPHQLDHLQSTRRQHASILKGNAVAFDAEFHKLRNSDSTGSRVHSLATSGVSSMNRSSDSSMMSMLSSGVLSQNELIHFALLQQQQSGQMAPLHETVEWNDTWDQTSNRPSQEIQQQHQQQQQQQQQQQNGMMGGGAHLAAVESLNNSLPGGASVYSRGSSGMQDSDRRRMFQQNREQSQTYLSSNVKTSDVNGNHNFRTSQLTNASLGTLGSMSMEPVHMPSMGIGSTNTLPMNAANENTCNTQINASEDIKAQLQRVANMQHRMSGMGLDPLLISDNSLMNMLAEAAANSESLDSAFGVKSSIEPESQVGAPGTSTGSVPCEASLAVPGYGNVHVNPASVNHDPVASVPTAADAIAGVSPNNASTLNHLKANINANDDGNSYLNADPSSAPVTSMGMQSSSNAQSQNPCVLPDSRGVQWQPGYCPPPYNTMQSTREFDPIPLGSVSNDVSSPLSNDEVDCEEMKAPPKRGVSRGISGLSTKSDASMGDASWLNQVRNLASLRNMGDDSRGDDSRFRLFSENSTRYASKLCRRIISIRNSFYSREGQ